MGFWFQVDSTAGTSGRLVFVDEKVGTWGEGCEKDFPLAVSSVGPLDSCDVEHPWGPCGPSCGLIESTYSTYTNHTFPWLNEISVTSSLVKKWCKECVQDREVQMIL